MVYILFHTGLRISEFCGLTLKDVDLENKILNIDHQLQRTSSMKYVIEKTKTNAGTRKLPMSDDVCDCFRTILAEREAPQIEKMVDGYSGFLFLDEDGMPLVAMHWEHRFNHNELMKNGWRMKEIDEMDMLRFLRLRAWDARREQEKKKPRQRFIDEVWPGVKPG